MAVSLRRIGFESWPGTFAAAAELAAEMKERIAFLQAHVNAISLL